MYFFQNFITVLNWIYKILIWFTWLEADASNWIEFGNMHLKWWNNNWSKRGVWCWNCCHLCLEIIGICLGEWMQQNYEKKKIYGPFLKKYRKKKKTFSMGRRPISLLRDVLLYFWEIGHGKTSWIPWGDILRRYICHEKTHRLSRRRSSEKSCRSSPESLENCWSLFATLNTPSRMATEDIIIWYDQNQASLK